MSADPESIRMREAVLEDAAILREWRNDPITRAMSLQSDVVPWESHLRWVVASLANDHRVILIAEDSERAEPLGMCRFDLEGTPPVAAEVSINLAPEQRGRGLGTAVLTAGIQALEASHPGVRTMLAVVRAENVPSVRLFEAAGFRPTGTSAGVVVYERRATA